MTQVSCFFSTSRIAEKYSLENRVKESFNSRLASSGATYNQEEVQTVTKLSARLFPREMSLDYDTSERMRELCKLSALELRILRPPRSHRKFVGHIIVALKKLTWPFVKCHLQDSFVHIGQFQSRAVEHIARQQVQIWKLSAEKLSKAATTEPSS